MCVQFDHTPIRCRKFGVDALAVRRYRLNSRCRKQRRKQDEYLGYARHWQPPIVQSYGAPTVPAIAHLQNSHHAHAATKPAALLEIAWSMPLQSGFHGQVHECQSTQADVIKII